MSSSDTLTDGAPGAAPAPQRNLIHLSIIIVVGIFATTLPQPQVLGKLPLQKILHDELHVTKPEMAQFFFLCGLFWYLKPFAGILTDAFPIFKTRRRHYLLFSSALAFASWLALGRLPHNYQSLLIGCIVVNLFMVMMSTVTGAYLVEAGQALGATGRLSSVRQVVSNACTLVNGPLSGFLATAGFGLTSVVNATTVLAMFPVVYVFLKEKPVATRSNEAFINAGKQLKILFASKNLWWGILFLGMFYFAPGFSTPLYYQQKEVLKFSDQFIGNLGVGAGLMGILSAVLYSYLIKRVNIKVMMFSSIALAASGTLFYLLYKGPNQALLIEAQNGFFFGFAEVTLLDFAARATPAGCEGMGYSLILSIRNIAIFGADIVGSKLAEDLKWPFERLVFLNAGTTAIVLILLPFLPAAILKARDKAA